MYVPLCEPLRAILPSRKGKEVIVLFFIEFI